MVDRMEDFKEKMSKQLFGRSRQDKTVCVTCGGPITGFRDELSKKEFNISGMCQHCQDSIFGDKGNLDETESLAPLNPEISESTYESGYLNINNLSEKTLETLRSWDDGTGPIAELLSGADVNMSLIQTIIRDLQTVLGMGHENMTDDEIEDLIAAIEDLESPFMSQLLDEKFASKAQARYFWSQAGQGGKEGEQWKKWAKEFSEETPDFEDLPEKVG